MAHGRVPRDPFLLPIPPLRKGSMEQEDRMSETMSGAEMVIRALQDQGVEHVFGYPGGAVLPIYDALFHQDKVKHVLVRHEQGAVHAAEGYARSSGRSEEHTSELQSRQYLVCRLLLEKKRTTTTS